MRNKITPDAHPSPNCNTYRKALESQNHIYKCAYWNIYKHQTKALKTMEREGKEAAINNFLICTLTKEIFAWMHNLPYQQYLQNTIQFTN